MGGMLVCYLSALHLSMPSNGDANWCEYRCLTTIMNCMSKCVCFSDLCLIFSIFRQIVCSFSSYERFGEQKQQNGHFRHVYTLVV